MNALLGIQYDTAGNLAAIGGFTFAYDAENRLVSSTLNSVSTDYAYDGEGRRVKKGSVVMVYDAFGRLAAEYGGTADPVGMEYLTADHLGSTRLVTSSTGAERRCLDYLPFGEQMTQGMGTRGPCYASATEPRVKFTGKERDQETGLDYFESRYFSAAQGRFISPDVLTGKREWLADPQRWNRYAYVRNNPLKYIDPNGEDLIIYTFYSHDLTEEQKKYLQANMRQIQVAIAEKFRKAGVEKIEFRDGSKLSQKQIAKILEMGRTMSTTGIGLLNFADKSFSGFTSGAKDLGATASDSRSAVFLGRIADGLMPGDTETLNFRLGEVAAHELGHGQGFESDSATWNWIKDLGGNPVFGFGNLMGEGQGIPRRPKNFDPSQDRTQRAIREINRIGDNTPKP